MSDEQMRREFEAWIKSPPRKRSTARYHDDQLTQSWPGQYEDFEVQLAWEAFQAARAQSAEVDPVEFTCHGNSAPAYSCNKPGDMSGTYYTHPPAREQVPEET